MVTIYTRHSCPLCKKLKEKLTAKQIEFEETEDLSTAPFGNFSFLPVLVVEGYPAMIFKEAIKWIQEQPDPVTPTTEDKKENQAQNED